MNLIGNLIQKSIFKTNIKILTCPCHETWESMLCSMPNIEIYSLYHDNVKKWNSVFRKCPDNYHLLKDGIIPLEINFDLVLSHNKFGMYQLLSPIAKQYNIPLISIEHTGPVPDWSKKQLINLKALNGDINVFITHWNRKAWGYSDNEGTVIEHGIDSEIFKPIQFVERSKYILSVCNQFNKKVRFWCCGFPQWNEIIQPEGNQSLPWAHLGDSCGDFAQPAKSLQDLINHYNKALIFLNTSLISPIPMSLLEAASMACCPISMNTCDIPNIFTHKHDALLSNNPQELREFCVKMLNNPQEARRIGNNARETIKNRFSPDRFKKDWAKVFTKALAL